MTTTSTETIVHQLTDFMGGATGSFANFFCGIAPDIRARLFQEHNVWEFAKNWKYLEAIDDVAARSVERQLRTLGCKGSSTRYSGGRCVYVYKILPTTIE